MSAFSFNVQDASEKGHIDQKIDFSEIIELGNRAFYKQPIKGVVNLENLEQDSIGKMTFGQTEIEQVILPENITRILNDTSATTSEGAFYACANLESINLDYITEIGVDSFRSCTKLKLLTTQAINKFKEAVEEAGDNLTADQKNTAIIEASNYNELSNLKKIKTYGFNNSGIQKIKLSGVEDIGIGAFLNCISLRNIEISGNCTKVRK